MKRKKGLVITLIILAFLFIVIFSLPKIFSTKIGKDFLLKKIELTTNAKIEADSFNLNWFGPQSVKNLRYEDANIDLQLDSITSDMNLFSFYRSFRKHRKFTFTANTLIDNLNINFHYSDYPKASVYNTHALIKADENKINSISITAKTKENNKTGNVDAKLEFDKDKINAKIYGTKIPTMLVDRFLLFYNNNKKYQNMLTQFIGPSFDIELTCVLNNLSGPINTTFNSTYMKAYLPFYYQKDKITLQKAASITIDLPGINPKFFKKTNYIKSIEPIYIKISEKDFEIPISPFKLEKLKVARASIDLNKMVVSNTGAIQSLINFTKQSASDTVSLWLTSVNIQISNKVLYADRLDFLINNETHLCLWGKVDLFDHNLRLNLGLPADTLTSVFGIKNLPNDYVIKVPIKGTIENPQIDMKGATAKIVALSALQSGKGIGSIIGGVITRIQKDDDIPPPKQPFPWEGKVQQKTSPQLPIDLENIFENFK